MQVSNMLNYLIKARSDEDPPIPIPPGEEPPPPIEEPPDKPVVGPDAPVREPGPREPRRLSFRRSVASLRFVSPLAEGTKLLRDEESTTDGVPRGSAAFNVERQPKPGSIS